MSQPLLLAACSLPRSGAGSCAATGRLFFLLLRPASEQRHPQRSSPATPPSTHPTPHTTRPAARPAAAGWGAALSMQHACSCSTTPQRALRWAAAAASDCCSLSLILCTPQHWPPVLTPPVPAIKLPVTVPPANAPAALLLPCLPLPPPSAASLSAALSMHPCIHWGLPSRLPPKPGPN